MVKHLVAAGHACFAFRTSRLVTLSSTFTWIAMGSLTRSGSSQSRRGELPIPPTGTIAASEVSPQASSGDGTSPTYGSVCPGQKNVSRSATCVRWTRRGRTEVSGSRRTNRRTVRNSTKPALANNHRGSRSLVARRGGWVSGNFLDDYGKPRNGEKNGSMLQQHCKKTLAQFK